MMGAERQAQKRNGARVMVEEVSYNWLVWQYEAVCLNCGRRLFLPDGESCLYCGGDELRVLGQATYELTMHAGTGHITVKKDCTWLEK